MNSKKENLYQNKRRGRFIRYAPLFLWTGVIFILSSGQGAMTQTSRFIRPFLEFLFPGAPEETLILYHSYIRKFAHLAEYAVLALLAFLAFSSSSKKLFRNYLYIFSLLFVFLVASLDEFNQSFNTARTGTFQDVLLDSLGGVTMLLLLYFWNLKRSKNKISQSV